MKVKLTILIAVMVSFTGMAIAYNHLHKPKDHIALANIDILVKAIVKDIASQELSKDEVRAKTGEALSQLDQVIQSIAKEKGIIVLNNKAVLAGSPGLDITTEIATKFNDIGAHDKK
jgi:hypothetical protein